MKISYKIECIGDNQDWIVKLVKSQLTEVFNKEVANLVIGNFPKKFFIAEITGFDPKFKFKRNFLPFKKDYTEANSVGSRGVFAYYILESGKIYDIKEPKSWKYFERFYCQIDETGNIIKLTEEEVIQWLKNH